MATPEEIIKKVNSGELVKFHKKYWPDFAGYVALHGIDFKCRMIFSGDAVILGDKSPSPCRHTLEDGADATTELVSGKSSGLIGGMRQEKADFDKPDEKVDINHTCGNCQHYYGNTEFAGTCYEHENLVERNQESCSWYVADTRP